MNEKKRKSKKDVELRLIAELMKNSRRSDRELARALGVSQPTVSRIRTRLENEGMVKEYTMIPDFVKLGYQIMAFTFAKMTNPATDGTSIEVTKAVVETESKKAFANVIGVRGLGLGKDMIALAFYKNYAAYAEAMRIAEQIPQVDMESFESFLVDLNDKNNRRILTMAQIARHILEKKE